MADESEDDDSEDDAPTPEEEEEARAAIERGELRARSELCKTSLTGEYTNLEDIGIWRI